MLRTRNVFLVGLVVGGALAFSLAGSAALAVPFQVNPSVVGAPQSSFTASVVDFSYSATVNQQTTGGAATCTVANPCNFQETGTGSFSNFKQADFTTPVVNSGLNQSPGYTLTGKFSGSGTVTPLATGTGLQATFNTFDLQILANGSTVVGNSAGLVSGDAHAFGADLAKGDFHVVVKFNPNGGFLSGPFVLGLNTADFAGNNTSLTGFTFGSFSNGQLLGSGNLTFNTIPEPSSVLLLGSGLVAIGWVRRRLQRASDLA